MLSLKRYGWLCVLGIEALYALCYFYGYFIPANLTNLHRSLFELLPGVYLGGVLGFLAGATDLFLFAWIVAWYMVWMHNYSLKNN